MFTISNPNVTNTDIKSEDKCMKYEFEMENSPPALLTNTIYPFILYSA